MNKLVFITSIFALVMSGHSLFSLERGGGQQRSQERSSPAENGGGMRNNGGGGQDQEDNSERLNVEPIYEENVNGVESFTTTPPDSNQQKKPSKTN